jgi:histidinol phosphatase-like PHP family hydrolase
MCNGDLSNSAIAELLARAAEDAKMPLQKALRRASRKALFWEEEASVVLAQQGTLTDLPGIGPSLNRIIRSWIENPPSTGTPPDIRRHFLTLTNARRILAGSSLTMVKGDLQMHTMWSDGSGTVADMATAAAGKGYEYIAVTDHSKGLKIAGGIDETQLHQQGIEIEQVNAALRAEGHRLTVLKSVELNLDPQGRGDMEKHSLDELDLVLGCFHSALRKKEDQTARYLAALQNSDIHILGHPQGRIYNYRSGLNADWAQVFDLAAKLDKAVEIDAYPDRQDLSSDLLKIAKRSGCRISLGTDAHDPEQLRFMEYGLASALAVGISPDRILNFMSADELRNWAATLRSSQN